MDVALGCLTLQRSSSGVGLNEGLRRRPVFVDDTWVGTRHAQSLACRPSLSPESPQQRRDVHFFVSAARADPDQLCWALQQGTPFPRVVAERLLEITGIHLTLGGLCAMYTKASHQLHWRLEDLGFSRNGRSVGYTVCADNAVGQKVLRAGKLLQSHQDQSLELHSYSMFVQKEARGRGLTSRCEALEERMLQMLSDHPRTRLTLAAGYAVDPLRPHQRESAGYYVHAMRGYLFADDEDNDIISHFPIYDARCPQDDPKRIELPLIHRPNTARARYPFDECEIFS